MTILRAVSSVVGLFVLTLTGLGTEGLIAPARARAWCRMTTSTRPQPENQCFTEGVPLFWRRRCSSYAFYIGGSTSISFDDARAAFSASFETWQSVDCAGARPGFQVSQLTALTTASRALYNAGGQNIQTVVFLSAGDWAARMYRSQAYAVTTVFHNTRTGEIIDVDMEINEGRGPYASCLPTGCVGGTSDLQNLVTHEAGHYFGFAHSPITEATMYAMAAPGEISKRTLHPDDTEAMCMVYPPTGSTLQAGCDPTPAGGFPPLNDAGQYIEGTPSTNNCGCRVSSSRGAATWLPVVMALGVILGVRVRRHRKRTDTREH